MRMQPGHAVRTEYAEYTEGEDNRDLGGPHVLDEPEIRDDDRADQHPQDGEKLSLRDEVGLARFVDQLGNLEHGRVNGHLTHPDEQVEAEGEPQQADREAAEQKRVPGHTDEGRQRGVFPGKTPEEDSVAIPYIQTAIDIFLVAFPAAERDMREAVPLRDRLGLLHRRRRQFADGRLERFARRQILGVVAQFGEDHLPENLSRTVRCIPDILGWSQVGKHQHLDRSDDEIEAGGGWPSAAGRRLPRPGPGRVFPPRRGL